MGFILNFLFICYLFNKHEKKKTVNLDKSEYREKRQFMNIVLIFLLIGLFGAFLLNVVLELIYPKNDKDGDTHDSSEKHIS